ncbi:MAG: hypothetical protein ACRDD8_13700 [Bacteroidales bacterium]
MIKDKITLKGREYTIPTLTIGIYRDIEVQKDLLSKSTFVTLALSPLPQAKNAVEAFEIEATIRVMFPELANDLIVSFDRLGIKDYLEIKDCYINQIKPLIDEVDELMKP